MESTVGGGFAGRGSAGRGQQRSWALLSALLLAGSSIWLTCTDKEDPFADPSNARAMIALDRAPFHDGDTAVPMYATRQVPVVVLVSGLVSSFSVHVDSNRCFTDTIIESPGSREYLFPVSFCDTGWMTLTVGTKRSDGDISVETWHVRVVSPLSQADIQAQTDQQVLLRTAPVQDSGVWYHWAIGNDTTYPRDTLSADVWEKGVRLSAIGTLPGCVWVSADEQGLQHVSPAKPFRIVLDDSTGPEIVCLNEVHGDTIVSADSMLVFLALISDGGGVQRVTINDSIVAPQPNGRYSCLLAGLEKSAVPSMALVVLARDGSGNTSTQTFRVVYDPSAIGSQRTFVSVDSVDSTGLDSLLIRGSVREYAAPTVRVAASVNGTAQRDTSRFTLTSEEARFGIWVRLVAGANAVTVFALNDSGRVLDDTIVTIIYVQGYADRDPPRIVSVSAAGVAVDEGHKLFVSDTDVAVTVEAYDPGSGIRSVSLNGHSMAGDGQGYWTDTAHGVTYGSALPVQVVAYDNAGNVERFSFLVQRNTPPELPAGWVWPARLFANDSTVLTLDIVDQGTATLALSGAPPGMTALQGSVTNRWVIAWRPTVNDTGAQAVAVVMSDAYESTNLTWHFTVLRDSSSLVRFATKSSDLPAFVQAVSGTLSAPLTVVAATGTPPFTFRVVLDRDGQVLLDTLTSERTVTLHWTPRMADTGQHQLEATVTDKQGDADALYHDLLVVAPNSHPCSLSVAYSAGTRTTADGAIDMSLASGSDTARFTIVDADNPLVERHTLYITRGNVTTVKTVDSSGVFDVVIDPEQRIGYDTVDVVVTDLTGTSAEIVLRVWYGAAYPPLTSGVLKVWADASIACVTLVAYGDTQYVSAWEGAQSLFGFTVNTLGLPPPTYVATGSMPALHFVAAQKSCLVASNSRSLWSWCDSAFTVFVVARPGQSMSAGRFTMLSATSRDSGYIGLGVVNGTCGVFSSMNSDQSGVSVSAGAWSVVSFRSEAGRQGTALTVSAWVNGVAGTPMQVTEAFTPYHTMVGATQPSFGTNAWDGDMAEVDIYRGALNDSDRRQVELFMYAKYGIPGQ